MGRVDEAIPRLIAKLVGHTGAVNSVAYNDNGTMALTVSQDDTAIVWNMDNPAQPTPMATLTGHTGKVLSASFSADGSTVITGSSDESVITWNVSQLVTITDDPRRAACTLAGPFDRQGWRSWGVEDHPVPRQLLSTDGPGPQVVGLG